MIGKLVRKRGSERDDCNRRDRCDTNSSDPQEWCRLLADAECAREAEVERLIALNQSNLDADDPPDTGGASGSGLALAAASPLPSPSALVRCACSVGRRQCGNVCSRGRQGHQLAAPKCRLCSRNAPAGICRCTRWGCDFGDVWDPPNLPPPPPFQHQGALRPSSSPGGGVDAAHAAAADEEADRLEAEEARQDVEYDEDCVGAFDGFGIDVDYEYQSGDDYRRRQVLLDLEEEALLRREEAMRLADQCDNDMDVAEAEAAWADGDLVGGPEEDDYYDAMFARDVARTIELQASETVRVAFVRDTSDHGARDFASLEPHWPA